MKLPGVRARLRAGNPPAAVPSPSDHALFLEAIGEVRVFTPPPEPPSVPAPEPQARSRIADDLAVIEELRSGGFEGVDGDGTTLLEYLAPGYSPKLLRKLKRGQYVLGDEFDLHNFSVDHARAALQRFLNEAREHGILAVRVIHGKGVRSGPEGPVLKRLTETVLRQRRDVIAFASCKPAAGGSGAVMVLLKA